MLPRDASTVVLFRERTGAPDETDLEVYLLRRRSSMAFAGGCWVFPGGSVDLRDHDTSLAWAGPPPRHWADVMGTTAELARALVCAAVRETFEESGVLLAGSDDEHAVSDTSGPGWEEDRRRLEAGDVSLAEVLRDRRLVLRSDLLRWWGRWVTPAGAPRRYDTRFFVAQLPVGQVTRPVSTEASEVGWFPAREAVTAAGEGRLAMMPPTYATCRELSAYHRAADVLAAAGERRTAPPTASRPP